MTTLRRIHRMAAPVVFVTLVAGLVASCTGSSSDDAGPQPINTMSDFASAADRICAQANTTAEQLDAPDGGAPLTAWASYANTALPLVNREYQDLDRLAGQQLRSKLAPWLAHLRRRGQVLQSLAWATEANDTTAAAFEQLELRNVRALIINDASALGLHECAGTSTSSLSPSPSVTSSAPTTRQSYIEAANTLCAASSNDVAQLDLPRTLPQLASYLGKVIASEKALDQVLDRLPQPVADRGTLREFAQERDAIVLLLTTAEKEAKAGSATATDSALTKVRSSSKLYAGRVSTYGLDACA